MGKLEKYKDQLPATIEGLHEFILIGKEKIKLHKAKVKAINNTGMAEEVYQIALEDGQDAGTAVVYAEIQLGELLGKIPKKGNEYSSSGGTIPSLPEGIDKKISHEAQTLAKNPDKVEESIIKSIQEGKIPTPDTVYKEIRIQTNIENRQKIKDKFANNIELKGEKKYRIIYADPPWLYNQGKDLSDKYGDVKKHYPPMETEKICDYLKQIKLQVEKDCVLFLWVTAPKLPEGLKVMESWGFQYKTNIVWDKIKHNFGFYFSIRHELLLIGGIGKSTPDIKKLYDSVISIERNNKHSEKPAYFRELIDELYPIGNRIEGFAREKIPGWDNWGNEL